MKTYETMVWGLNVMELLSCVTAFAYYKKLQASKWRLFPFYLLAIVLLEVAGRFLAGSPELRRFNPYLFNYIGFPLQFLFFYWIFYKDASVQERKFITAGVMVYLVSVFADAVYFSGKTYFFHSFSYSTGNIILLVLLISYFYKLSTSDSILLFSRNIMFWVSLGVFIYYVGTLPLWSLRNVLAFQHPAIFLKYSYISFILDYLMYLFFIIGIIRCKLK